MKWFTSDLHFGHELVIKYANRPFISLDEMHEELIKRWNSKVCKDDTIYILGDMSFLPHKEFEPIAKQLNGNKILIIGNHDKYSIGQYAKYGFTAYHECLISLCGKRVRLSHFPYALPWYKKPFAFKSELRFMDRRPHKIKGEILLHGHTHTKKKVINNMIHVGVDAWNYAPISEGQIESLMSKI